METSKKHPCNQGSVAWTSTDVVAWMRGRLIAAGLDPAVIPDEPVRFVRMREVIERTGLRRSTLYRLSKECRFPKPVVLR